MTQGQLFDINAILAGSAEVYTAIEDTVPPVLGYPITRSDPGSINDDTVIGLFTRGTGMTLWDGMSGTVSDPGGAVTAEIDIEDTTDNKLTLGAITFDISREKPTLKVKLIGDAAAAAASKTLANKLSTATGNDRRSLFIQYFGRSAEFPFEVITNDNKDTNPNGAIRIESAETATDPHETTYVWEIDNESDANRFRAYTLFQICLLYTSPSPRDS